MGSDHSCLILGHLDKHRSPQSLILLHLKKKELNTSTFPKIWMTVHLFLLFPNACFTCIFILNSFNVLITLCGVRKHVNECLSWQKMRIFYWAHHEPLTTNLSPKSNRLSLFYLWISLDAHTHTHTDTIYLKCELCCLCKWKKVLFFFSTIRELLLKIHLSVEWGDCSCAVLC